MPEGRHGRERTGVLGAAGRLFDSSVSILRARLELASTELQEEGARLARVVVLSCLGLLFLMMTVLLLTLFVVVLFWDTHRLEALGGAAALYLVLTVILVAMVRRGMRRRAPLLASTVAELRKDCERLGVRR